MFNYNRYIFLSKFIRIDRKPDWLAYDIDFSQMRARRRWDRSTWGFVGGRMTRQYCYHLWAESVNQCILQNITNTNVKNEVACQIFRTNNHNNQKLMEGAWEQKENLCSIVLSSGITLHFNVFSIFSSTKCWRTSREPFRGLKGSLYGSGAILFSTSTTPKNRWRTILFCVYSPLLWSRLCSR